MDNLVTRNECEYCDGSGEGYFSCCTSEPVEREHPLCPVCKEHLGLEKCPHCNEDE